MICFSGLPHGARAAVPVGPVVWHPANLIAPRWGVRYFVVAASTLAFNAAAFAATVASIDGHLNTGSGFSGRRQVAPGGAVMVGPGGKGRPSRTAVTLGTVAVVAPISPCAQGQAEPEQDSK
jgi:hypothetical protein